MIEVPNFVVAADVKDHLAIGGFLAMLMLVKELLIVWTVNMRAVQPDNVNSVVGNGDTVLNNGEANSQSEEVTDQSEVIQPLHQEQEEQDQQQQQQEDVFMLLLLLVITATGKRVLWYGWYSKP